MEDTLEVYHRPYNEKFPMVCLDETNRQLIAETRKAIPAKPGQNKRVDYEYRRNGVVNLFMMFEPLKARRHVKVMEQRTRKDFAQCIRELVDIHYPDAEKIVLVLDNLNTHSEGSLYEAFEPAEARRLAEKLEIHYTPKHGSWLNVAEIELSVFTKQCLDRRIPDMARLEQEAKAWYRKRNANQKAVDWQFTTEKARIKLKKLYPQIQML